MAKRSNIDKVIAENEAKIRELTVVNDALRHVQATSRRKPKLVVKKEA